MRKLRVDTVYFVFYSNLYVQLTRAYTSAINWQQIHKVYKLTTQHSLNTLLHTFDGQGHSEVDKYTHKNHHLQQPLDHCSTVCVAGYFVKSCKLQALL